VTTGQNGEGSTLTNIYSTSFIVDTADGKNRFLCGYYDNLHRRDNPKVTKNSKNYTRLNIDTLLRGDMKSRYDAYGVGRQWGWLSVNDILRLEGRNGIGPDGDIYLQPVNMVEAGTEPVAPPATPAEPAPAEPPKPANVAELRLVAANLRRTA
jgi:hypothetical protein